MTIAHLAPTRALLVAVVLLGLGLTMMRRAAPPPVAALPIQTAEPRVAAAPPEATVKIELISDPTGATVIRPVDGGVVGLGQTPMVLVLPRGFAFDVRLILDGYRSVTKNVTADEDKSIVFKLVPARAKKHARK